MKTLSIVTCLALTSTVNAQFSVSSNAGSGIPAAGSTGDNAGWDPNNVNYDLLVAAAPGTASVDVPVTVNCINSIVLDSLVHSWMGDTMCVLRDPTGVGYLIWLRPEIEIGEYCCGNAGDFANDTYTFVEAGTDPNSQGVLPQTGGALPGIWDQDFSSNDAAFPVVWPSGEEMVFNTPLSQITGPAGVWTICIYDFAPNDAGGFTNFTLNGNTCGSGIGLDDASCVPLPNSTGFPAVLTLAGSAVAGMPITASVSQGPVGQFGYFLSGPNSGLYIVPPGSAGIICIAGPQYRYNNTVLGHVFQFDPLGVSDSLSGGGASVLQTDGSYAPVPAVAVGETRAFQSWYRDGPVSNFSNSTRVMFL